ncbi:hypothetical protein D6C98_10283, partial [Aureobasidium pullulans]
SRTIYSLWVQCVSSFHQAQQSPVASPNQLDIYQPDRCSAQTSLANIDTIRHCYIASGPSSHNSKQAMALGKSPGKTRPISRALPPIALCECRDRKTLRVFPRFSNPLTPCDWGQRETKTDASGHTWEVHHLEIKECLPAPSHTPLAPGIAPQVMLRGESATRMSDALESMMQILDQLPNDWRPSAGAHKLPVRAEHLPAFESCCSMCGLPRKDLGWVTSKSPTSHKLRR